MVPLHVFYQIYKYTCYQLDEQMDNCQPRRYKPFMEPRTDRKRKSSLSWHLPRFLNTSWSILTYELMDGELIRACGQITHHQQRVRDKNTSREQMLFVTLEEFHSIGWKRLTSLQPHLLTWSFPLNLEKSWNFVVLIYEYLDQLGRQQFLDFRSCLTYHIPKMLVRIF